jgi:SAM-dependent methyltransferase
MNRAGHAEASGEFANPASFQSRMQAAYDAIAPIYAAAHAPLPDDLRLMAERLLALVDGQGPLLDAGCGPGRDMAWLEAQGLGCTGIDLSRGMLRQARSVVRGPLLQMDMRRLAFDDRCFDAIWCCASLLHLPKAEAPQAIAELRRVLRPGGACFVAVQEGTGEAWERRRRFGAVERFFARYHAEELAGLLEQHGFVVLEQRMVGDGSVRWLQMLAG